MQHESKLTILGTGNLARNLATLATQNGYKVTMGSRDPGSARAHFDSAVEVLDHQAAADASSLLVLAVPFSVGDTQTARELLSSLQNLDDKILIEATNPLGNNWAPLSLGDQTSAAEILAQAAPKAHLVKALNTVFADNMTKERIAALGLTGFYAGDEPNAKATVAAFLERLGFSPRDAGPLSSSRYLEAMAHLNITIALNTGAGTGIGFRFATLS